MTGRHAFHADPWIARDLFSLQRVYERSRTPGAFDYAQRVARWLRTDYPDAEYTRMSGFEIACMTRGGCPPSFFRYPP